MDFSFTNLIGTRRKTRIETIRRDFKSAKSCGEITGKMMVFGENSICHSEKSLIPLSFLIDLICAGTERAVEKEV